MGLPSLEHLNSTRWHLPIGGTLARTQSRIFTIKEMNREGQRKHVWGTAVVFHIISAQQ